MSRVLAIDYGSKRIGIAISDALWITAQTPIGPIINNGKAIKRFLGIIREYDVQKIVVGLPSTTGGQEGDSARAARNFGKKLQKASGLPVIYIDERFTSIQARKRFPGKMTSAQRKSIIDNASAQIILEQFLTSNSNK